MNADRDILDALSRVAPPQAPKRLDAWLSKELGEGREPETPTREAFEDHAQDLFSYLTGLTGRDAWLAEELLLRAFARADADLPDRVALFQHARHAALEVLAKSGSPTTLPPADHALLLERRLGLDLDELARAWGTRPESVESRLLDAALAAAPAGGDAPPCVEWRDDTARAALDLLDKERAELWTGHLSSCAACAGYSERLEALLALPDAPLPAPERTWERIAEGRREAPSAASLGIRVGVTCTYCHDGMSQAEAAFCAACLAPHHPECFAAHGRCATPACAGTQLVYPTERVRPRASASPWPMLGAVLLGGLGAAALTTDWQGGAAESEIGFGTGGSSTTGPVEPQSPPAVTSRPIPDLEPGHLLNDVVTAFGREPDATWERGGWKYLSYYADGARAVLDDRGRLIQASFFGVLEADGGNDANGNKPLFGQRGLYRPGGWSYRGQTVGRPVSPEALAGVTDTGVDADGNQYVTVDERFVFEIAGVAPYVVRAIHLSPGVTGDANGNLAPGKFDFVQNVGARDAAKRVLEGSRQSGDLERILGVRTWRGWDSDGQLVELVRTRVKRTPGDTGLDLTVDVWSLRRERVKRWSRMDEQITWDGRLTSYFEGGLEDGSQDGLRYTLAKPEGPGRYKVREDYDGKSRERIVIVDPEGRGGEEERCTSALFLWLVLPRLAPHLGRGEFSLEHRQPVQHESWTAFPIDVDAPAIAWQGMRVRRFGGLALVHAGDRETVRLSDLGNLGLLESEWLEPVESTTWQTLVARAKEPRSGVLPWPPGSGKIPSIDDEKELDLTAARAKSEHWISEVRASKGNSHRLSLAGLDIHRALTRGNDCSRFSALLALSKVGREVGASDSKPYVNAVLEVLTASKGLTRVAAFEALDCLGHGSKDILPLLHDAWEKERDRELELNIARLLVLVTKRDPGAAEKKIIVELMKSGDKALYEESVRALAWGKDSPGGPRLLVDILNRVPKKEAKPTPPERSPR